jgi:bacterioferritin (cytochrome b1)
MPTNDTINVLNRVLAILERSFPQYMRYARPYIPAGRENIVQTIEQLTASEDALAERVARQVFEAGGLPDHGEFPIDFTDTHDLSIDFLVCEAIDCLKQNVEDLQQCVDYLRQAPAAQSLAAEALGMTKAHLDMLQPLASGAGASTKIGATPAYANDAPVSTEVAGIPHRQEERKLAAGEPHSPS